ncbi:MAG TPA: carboxypeptidase regulatory-like domain-containing protein [Anaeromyxobacteraceae bacterium]|nr:carboxypeptidase regulatory-like domain-containing protein [Anaeromyxobacteraceae bacterium]
MSRRRLAFAAALAAFLAAVAVLLWPGRAPPPAPQASAPAAPAPPVPAPPVLPEAAPPAGPAVTRDPAGGPAAFEGRVLDFETRAGIAGAELVFTRVGAAASARSGRDGAFRFEPPALGAWQLGAVSAQGYLPFAPEWGHSPIALTARAGERVTGLAVHLRRAVVHRGVVLLPDGRPAEGAEVRLLGAAESALVPLADRFRSDARGEFEFQAPDGSTLEARLAGYAPGRAELELAARVSRRLVIRLGERREAEAPREAIAGRVVDAAGAGVEGALVTARRQRGRGPGSAEEIASAQSISGNEGRFRVPDLEPGRYLVSASRAGHAPARAVGVESGASDVTLELQAGGALRGRVRDRSTGAPLVPFAVAVRRPSGPLRWLPPRTVSVVDPSGEYRLDDLPPGPVIVSASAPLHAPSDDLEVTIPDPPGAATADFDLRPGGRVAGLVIDRVSRAPLPGALVQLEGRAGAGASVIALRGEAAAGPDGRFELNGLPSRPLSILVQAEGHHARILSGLVPPEGGVLGPVTVELSPVEAGEEPRVELAGIGVQFTPRGEALRIMAVLPGGGAAEAGLLVGDEILAVDGRPVSELGMEGSAQAIRGPEGSTVTLRVRRGPDGAPSEVTVWRRLVRG